MLDKRYASGRQICSRHFAGVDGDEKIIISHTAQRIEQNLCTFRVSMVTINIAKRGTDNLKQNPNEEQSDSDERRISKSTKSICRNTEQYRCIE